MENTNFQETGISLCKRLIDKDYVSISKQLGYALAFDKPIDLAIKEDFENTLQESGCNLDNVKYDVAVKLFPKDESEFIRLVECGLSSSNCRGDILAEIIQNKQVVYLEQISYVA